MTNHKCRRCLAAAALLFSLSACEGMNFSLSDLTIMTGPGAGTPAKVADPISLLPDLEPEKDNDIE